MHTLILGDALRRPNFRASITGYNVATYDLIRGLLRYGKADVSLLAEPGSYSWGMMERLLEVNGDQRNRHIQLVSEYDMLFTETFKQLKPDIIHSVKEDPVPLVSARTHMRIHAPLTFLFHGLAEQHVLTDTVYPLLLLPFRPYDAVLCSSKAVADTLRNMLSRLEEASGNRIQQVPKEKQIRTEIVPLGIDTDTLRPLDKAESRRALGLPQDSFIILWHGRFSQYFKADLFPLLLVFYKLLMRVEEKLCLVLAGSEDEGTGEVLRLRKIARALGISDNVIFLMNDSVPDKAQLYSSADVFTSPVDNLQETFGLTPVEAMACGVPQIVSDWGGYRDTVKEGITGFLIPTIWADCLHDIAQADYLPTNIMHRRLMYKAMTTRSIVVDSDSYYKRLLVLIQNKELRYDMSVASRKRAVEFFSLQENARRTEDVWSELLSRAKTYRGEADDFLVPMIDYCHDFQNYPTSLADGATIYRITDFGLKISLAQFEQLSAFQPILPERKLVNILFHKLKKDGVLDLNAICYCLRNWSSDQIIRSTMYLYKYSIICPAPK